MREAIPVGVAQFAALRARSLAYIDHSPLIAALIDRAGAEVVCLERPPGFGKSLGLSMLRCFFESSADQVSELFEGLAIAGLGERYQAHQQRYPVIAIGLGEGRCKSPAELRWWLRAKLRELADEHHAVLQSGALSGLDRELIEEILAGSASDDAYWRFPRELTRALHRVYGERTVLLVDDFDRPILDGVVHGYARAAVDIVGALLGAALSDNPHLARAVLTCTVPVVDHVASAGLGRALMCSLRRPALVAPGPAAASQDGPGADFASAPVAVAGCPEDALVALLTGGQRGQRGDDLRRWYGGHRVGDASVYRPDHVMGFLLDADARVGPRAASGSLPHIIRQLIERDIEQHRNALERLLAGDTVEATLAPQLLLDQLSHDPAALWPLLVSCGWLTAEVLPRAGTAPDRYALSVPNRQAHAALADAISSDRPKISGRASSRVAGDSASLATAARSSTGAEVPFTGHDQAAADRTIRPSRVAAVATVDEAMSVAAVRETRGDAEVGTRARPTWSAAVGSADAGHAAGALRRPGRPDIEIDADVFETELSQFFRDLHAEAGVGAEDGVAGEGAQDGVAGEGAGEGFAGVGAGNGGRDDVTDTVSDIADDDQPAAAEPAADTTAATDAAARPAASAAERAPEAE